MNLEKEITESLAKEMQQSMDFEIVAYVLVNIGWHLIRLDRYTDNHHAIDVREWVEANCTGEHRRCGATWLFESTADAVMFKLRWG